MKNGQTGYPPVSMEEIHPEIPRDIYLNWQQIIDLMVRILDVPAGLIMRVHPKQIEVFVTSSMANNPYEKGELADLDTNLYCETVMAKRSALHVKNALKDPDWDKNPDIEKNMIAYLGYPLIWPDGTVFGTICVLDSKENSFTKLQIDLVEGFANTINHHLKFLSKTATDEALFRSQTEESLLRLKSLSDNLPGGMTYQLDMGKDGEKRKLTYVSAGVEKIHGVTAEEALKDASVLYSQVIEADQIRIAEKEEYALKNMVPFVAEARFQRPSGEIRWHLIMSSPRRAMNGNLVCDGIELDITEQKLAETALLENERKFRSIFESSRDAIIITDEQRVMDCNTATQEMFGYSTKRELYGKHPADLSPSVQPDGRSSKQKADELLKRSLEDAGTVFEWIHQRKDGSEFPTEIQLSPMKWEGRDVVLAMIRDISKRKQAEKARFETLARFSGFAKASQYGMGMADLEGNIVYANPTLVRMLGEKTEDDCLGKNFPMSYYPPAMAKKLQEEVLPALMSDDHWHGELELKTIDGRSVLTDENYFVIRDEKGQPQYLANILTDISDRKLAEKALMESEEKYRTFFENSSDMILLLRDEKFVDCNAAAVAGLGYQSKEELLGTTPWELSPKHQPDGKDSEEKAHELMDIAYTRGAHRFEWNHLRKDGSLLPVEVSLTAIPSEGPRVLITMWRDISDRKRAENELRESEAKFKALAEYSIDTIMRFDKEHRHLYVNPVVESQVGIKPEEFIGKTHKEIGFPEELVNLWENAIDQVFISGKPNRLEFSLPEGIWLDWLLSPELSKDGEVVAVITSARDITERKQAEKALEESAEKLLEAQKMAHLGNWYWDVKTGEVDWSKEVYRIFRLDPDTFTPHIDSIMALSPWPEENKRNEELLQRAKTTKEPGEFEQKFLRPDGSIGYYSSTYQGIFNREGELFAIKGTVLDITERKQAEKENALLQKQLNQAQKMESIGRLAGGIAHDFNNLLTGIMGNVDLAMMELSPEDPLTKTLNEINKAAGSASDLTRQLLAFSRKQLIETKVFDPNELIESMSKMIKRLIGENIELSISSEKSRGRIKADPGQIEQVLVNFCVNAKDAIPDVGKLSIETKDVHLDPSYLDRHPDIQEGMYVLIAISDNGTGMDEETQAKIFDPFFTTKAIGKGTGLGLSTVYGIVKQHGGHIEVYSEPEVGTTFKVYFPSVKEEAESIARTKAFDALPFGTETILVVEDEELVLNIAIRVLRRQGYKVYHAVDGPNALHLMERENLTIDMLLTDTIMPNMSGRELAEKILRIYPQIKVLYTSGYTKDVIAHHGVLDKGVNFLGKPYSPQRLAMKVREVLDS